MIIRDTSHLFPSHTSINKWDVSLIIVGAGAAGMMAAIRAAQLNQNVVLLERNNSLGKKILLTGKGRCNITNSAPLEDFIAKFGRQGQFLRSAFQAFSNQDLIDFFENKGLKMKTERQGRVFPETDRAASVVQVLKSALLQKNIKILFNSRLMAVKKEGDVFHLHLEDGKDVCAKKAILATGGASYKDTGSRGDGFRIAQELGHTIIPLRAALVPLKTKESWVRQVQGLTLKNIRLSFVCGGKEIVSDIGELLFTHFGVSGPLVLDLSGAIVTLAKEHKGVKLLIDLKPGLSTEQLEKRILRDISSQGNKNIKNFLKEFLPSSMIPLFIGLLGLDEDKRCAYLTQKERNCLIRTLKELPLTITGSLPLEEAMVTAGGVSLKEINPRTMESRIVPGLYFAGEIIDACAPSGGFNLQQAFSTGYLAGGQAALCVK